MLTRRSLLRMTPVALVPTVAVAAPIVAPIEPVKDMSVLADYFMKTWTLPGGMKGEIRSIDYLHTTESTEWERFRTEYVWRIVSVPQLREPRLIGYGKLYIFLGTEYPDEKMFHREFVWKIAHHDAQVIGIHPEARNRFATAIEDSVNDGSFRYDIAIKLYTGLPNHPSKNLYSPEFMLPAIFPEKPDWI